MAVQMPLSGAKSAQFNLMTQDAVNDIVAGSGNATDLGQAYWDISLEVVVTSRRSARYRSWMSFLKGLRGQKLVGLFFDPDLPWPAFYATTPVGMTKFGGGSFDGTGAVTAVTNPRQITISGLPANFQFLADDSFGLSQGGRYFRGSLTADIVASSSGVAVLTFEPAMPATFTTSAIYSVVRPVCEAYLLSVDAPRDVDGGGNIRITARSRGF